MWHNKYIGMPYLDKGRDHTGVDCWGLVRLVYLEQFNIILPSFEDQYTTAEDLDLISSRVEHYKDGWDQITEPEIGSVILFKVMGTLSHVGIYIDNNTFIHARHGVGSVVTERLDSIQWQNRIYGFYKYNTTKNTVINSVPHPLQMTRYEDNLEPGSTVQDLVGIINTKYSVPQEIKADYAVFINGIPVAHNDWNTRIIETGDKVEYRAIAKGGGGIRSLLFLAVAIIVSMQAPGAAEYMFGSTELGTEGALITTGATKAQVAMTQMALTAAGMALVNAIAPIRMPGQPEDPGQANQQNLFQGGSNPVSKYAPIPVVLGTHRITPPLGAQQYIEYNEAGNKTYLKSLVVWGYGPLDVTDIQIGTKKISDYISCTWKTDNGFALNDSENNVYEIYGNDTWQTNPRIQLQNNSSINVGGSAPWTTINITEANTKEIKLSLHFPEGLRKILSNGTVDYASFTAEYQYIKIDANGNTIGSTWTTNTLNIPQTKITIPAAQITTTQPNYSEASSTVANTTTDYWRKVRVFIAPPGNLQYSIGAPTLTQLGGTDPAVLQKFYNTRYSNLTNTNEELTKTPSMPVGSILLYEFYIRGASGIQGGSPTIQVVGMSSYTGLTFSSTMFGSALLVTIASGTYTPTAFTTGTISIGDQGAVIGYDPEGNYIRDGDQAFSKYKDAFTYNVTIPNLDPSRYRLMIRRTNSDVSEPDGSPPAYRNYHKAYLYSVTAYTKNKPIAFPGLIAKTAVNILASDNVNGTLEGINGLVSSYCYDYNTTTGQWTDFRTTSNPASLFLYVLCHPANVYRIDFSQLSTYVDVATISSWWVYCQQKGFSYNNVISNTTSILDVLKDIAAAGRASPTLINGKWGVVIDRPKTVVQHFTPYNSWGFEATKLLVKKPHAFKISIRDESNAYQDETILVPNKGYTEETAYVIEEISLPGVTNKELAYLHGRWHLAQLDYRPETYTLNVDFEHLVCTRGDLVRVMHDVPLWGVGTSRINTVTSTTQIVLDDGIYLESGKTYTIRVRTQAGEFVSKTIGTIAQSQEYTNITVTSAFASTGSSAVTRGDLIIIEEITTETAELVVISIEPQDNITARLTLVDYSSELYEIDNTSGYPVSNFNNRVTLPPVKLIDTINVKPIFSSDTIISDERAIQKTGIGAFINNIVVSFTNPIDLPNKVSHIECNYDYNLVSSTQYQFSSVTEINNNSIVLENVDESVAYKLRLRYITNDGMVGPWSDTIVHTVIGKTSPPSNITNFTYTTDQISGKIIFKWDPITDIDLDYYEIRTSDTINLWTTNSTTSLVFKGNVTTCQIVGNTAGTTTNYYIRARDVAGNVSRTSQSQQITIGTPPIPVITSTQETLYAQASKSSSSALIEWTDGAFYTNNFVIAEYELEIINVVTGPPNLTTSSKFVKTKNKFYSFEITWEDISAYLPGLNAAVRLRSIDVAGNISDWTNPLVIYYQKPTQISANNITITTDKVNIINFSWPEPTRLSSQLPIAGYEVRAQDTGWGDNNYLFKGQKTFVDVTPIGVQPYQGTYPSELAQPYLYEGIYRWYLRSFDTSGEYSLTTILQYTLVPPPDINPATVSYSFQDTSLTNATVTISWDLVNNSAFGVAYYNITGIYTDKFDNPVSSLFITKANSITIPVDWLDSEASFTIFAEDNLTSTTLHNGIEVSRTNPANGITIFIPLYKPKAIENLRAEVVDNNVLFYWDIPSLKTNPLDANEQISRLPIAYTKFKRGSTWESATDLGNKSGSFTTLYERVGGTYTYWAAVVDTEGNEGVPVSIDVKVNQPPDYVFYNQLTSNLSTGTLTNGIRDPNTNLVLMPVDTSETWSSHFTSRSWTSPDNQISAGYTYFMQPGASTGTYQEVFDFGTVIASAQASITIDKTNISGSPNISYEILSSSDNATFTSIGSNTSSVNVQNFRYLGILITVTQATAGDLVEISNISIRLDSKIITDTGTVTSDTTAAGTIVNFEKSFLDVSSVTVSPNTSNAYVTTYDLRDYVETTVCYISSNQCYVLTPKAHGLETGQKINLYFARPPLFKPVFSQLGEIEYDNGKYTQKGTSLGAASNKLISDLTYTFYPNTALSTGFSCSMSSAPSADYGVGISLGSYATSYNAIPAFGWKMSTTGQAYAWANSSTVSSVSSPFGKRFQIIFNYNANIIQWLVNGTTVYTGSGTYQNQNLKFHAYLPQNTSILYPTFNYGTSDAYFPVYTSPASTVVTITKIDTYNFSFALTTADTAVTSLKYYPNSIRVFVYNQSGTRIGSVPVSWTVRGF